MGTTLDAVKSVAALAIIVSLVWLGLRIASPGGAASLTQWALSNGDKVRRGLAVVQVIAGLVLCLLGYVGGREHLHLILEGVRGDGRIVSYRQESLPNSGDARWNYLSLPEVEFTARGQTYRFEDSVGSGSEVLNQRVLVLYDPNHPATAMVERPIMNWVPWAPMIAVGLLLLISAARRAMRGIVGRPETTAPSP